MAPRFLAALALLAGFGAAELLNPTRIHLIDFATTAAGHTNYLFRGNMPRNETSFAIDELKAYMTLRTANASAPAFPADDVFIHVVSFNNVFELDDTNFESQFCRWYPNLCQVTFWPLIGNLAHPWDVPEPVRKLMATKLVWAVDQLPSRTLEMRSMLTEDHGRPVAFYVHCEAGCDRTGEFSGAYRIENLGMTVQQAWDLNVEECGRPPNAFSKGALEWFCAYAQYSFPERAIGDCRNM